MSISKVNKDTMIYILIWVLCILGVSSATGQLTVRGWFFVLVDNHIFTWLSEI